mmetsp:Transcript_94191/g.288141  ORF Transcript_94191/g.288141 Transcript_94191/m.288141 type:complete len:288 (+) Transcript_94191:363-1226(+)
MLIIAEQPQPRRLVVLIVSNRQVIRSCAHNALVRRVGDEIPASSVAVCAGGTASAAARTASRRTSGRVLVGELRVQVAEVRQGIAAGARGGGVEEVVLRDDDRPNRLRLRRGRPRRGVAGQIVDVPQLAASGPAIGAIEGLGHQPFVLCARLVVEDVVQCPHAVLARNVPCDQELLLRGEVACPAGRFASLPLPRGELENELVACLNELLRDQCPILHKPGLLARGSERAHHRPVCIAQPVDHNLLSRPPKLPGSAPRRARNSAREFGRARAAALGGRRVGRRPAEA